MVRKVPTICPASLIPRATANAAWQTEKRDRSIGVPKKSGLTEAGNGDIGSCTRSHNLAKTVDPHRFRVEQYRLRTGRGAGALKGLVAVIDSRTDKSRRCSSVRYADDLTFQVYAKGRRAVQIGIPSIHHCGRQRGGASRRSHGVSRVVNPMQERSQRRGLLFSRNLGNRAARVQ